MEFSVRLVCQVVCGAMVVEAEDRVGGVAVVGSVVPVFSCCRWLLLIQEGESNELVMTASASDDPSAK